MEPKKKTCTCSELTPIKITSCSNINYNRKTIVITLGPASINGVLKMLHYKHNMKFAQACKDLAKATNVSGGVFVKLSNTMKKLKSIPSKYKGHERPYKYHQ